MVGRVAGHGGRDESGDATAREESDEGASVPDGTPAQGGAESDAEEGADAASYATAYYGVYRRGE
eukprot:2540987-Prymnesium_polylepis.2